MAALATPADLCKRFDVRLLGDLVGDAGVRVGMPDLLDHENLQACIDDAWGEIIGALMMSQRYTQDQIDDLADESKQYLIRLNCAIAIGYLLDRRPWEDSDQRAAEMSKRERARKELEELRVGKKVLNIEDAKNAGLPEARTPSLSVVTRTNLVVDEARRGFYPSRRFSNF
jgi:phage gp36-like protein